MLQPLSLEAHAGLQNWTALFACSLASQMIQRSSPGGFGHEASNNCPRQEQYA